MDFTNFISYVTSNGNESKGKPNSKNEIPRGDETTNETVPITILKAKEHRSVTFARSISQPFSNLADRIRSTGMRSDPRSSGIHSDPPDLELSGSEESDGQKSNTTGTDSETSDSSGEERGRPHTRQERRRPQDRSISRSKLPLGDNTEEEEESHIALFAHGKIGTILGICFAWTGVAFSYLARQNTQFVFLDFPLYVDPTFNKVTSVGMINLELCLNQTYTGTSGCSIHELQSEEVNDTMFQFSRSVAFMAILLGCFLSLCLTSSIYWQSITLRPIGVGLLFTYFLQSFTFLFFDSELCAEHKCNLGSGSLYSVVASFCWITACVAAARMDRFKHRQRQLRQSRRRSRSRSRSPQKRPKAMKDRKVSDLTAATDCSNESLPRPRSESARPGRVRKVETGRREEQGPVVIEGIEDLEAAMAWTARKSTKPTYDSPRKSRSPKDRVAPQPREGELAFYETCGEVAPRQSRSPKQSSEARTGAHERLGRHESRSRSQHRSRSRSQARQVSQSPARATSSPKPRSEPKSAHRVSRAATTQKPKQPRNPGERRIVVPGTHESPGRKALRSRSPQKRSRSRQP